MYIPFKPEHISCFDGLIVFDPFYFLMVIAVVCHFGYIQYKEYRLSRFKIDYWGFNLGLKVIIPLFLMYPFNLSFLNYFSIGNNVNMSNQFIEAVLMVSILGYFMIYLGRYLYDSRNKPISNFTIFEKYFEDNLKSKYFLFMMQLVTFVLSFITIYQQISAGELFNGRNFYQLNIKFRPVYNILVFVYSINFITLFLFFLQTGKIKYLIKLIPLLLIGFTLGSRGALLEPILSCYLFWLFKNFKSVKIRYIFLNVFVFLIGVVALLALRGDSNTEISSNEIFFELFYGNTFSDSRDFAYVLTFWDSEYLYGRSYVAAFLSFVPKYMSELRQDWSFSFITNKLIGFDNNHPGMRLGVFGEAFFNFSYIGVTAIGLLYGYIMRAIDLNIKSSVVFNRDMQKAFSKTFVISLLSGLTITSSFPSFYMLLIVTFICIYVRRFFFFEKSNKVSKLIIN